MVTYLIIERHWLNVSCGDRSREGKVWEIAELTRCRLLPTLKLTHNLSEKYE